MANSFLPDFTKSCLAENGANNLEDLDHYLVKVSVDEEIVQSKVLGRLLRIIQTRLDLKYDTDDALRSRILSVLLDTYRNRRCPIPLKTRLLSVAGRLCKNKRHDIRLAAPLDWEYHWEELISVCTRSKKYEEIASEVVLGKLLQTQVAFLHSARRFLSDAEGHRVVERAMCQLKDPRHSSSVEGLFLLVICLPTAYTGYDACMHEWMSVWSRVEHNALWDACWLTLLCRARKSLGVYRSFDWSHVFSFLLTKTKELLNLPGPVSSRPSNPSAYPNAIPGQYLFLGCTSPFDARKTALHKVAKLLYSHCFYSFNGAPFELVPAAPLPISHCIPEDAGSVTIPGLNASTRCIVGARDLATFYGSIRVYFHPSNTGSWSQDLGFLLGTQIGELARHVGREVAIRHGSLQSGYLNSVVRTPLHESTVEFLIGLFSSLLLEMLYSKNFILSHIAAHGLKNLAPLCPALCGAIVPGLVATLDPAAVSKSHMALPAMTALSITFKSFLFPDPVILQYLPTILRLTLPGIDPNDDKKTLLALNLYSKILAWVPIGESVEMKSSDSPALLPLALGKPSSSSGAAGSAALLESTKAAMVEWAPLFLDRILALLDATEDSNQHTVDGSGARSRRHRSGSARERKGPSRRLQSIEDCLRLFFAGMDAAVANGMCVKVLDHVRSANPLHAAKEYTTLLCTMLSSHPNQLLQRTLSDLLDAGLQTGECSAEKLAFRLHLVGGIVRRSTCTELLRPRTYGGSAQGLSAVEFLQPFVQPEFTVKHPDIRVQEAARKLVRDLLRGLSAVVPLETSPVPHGAAVVLGETSPERSSVVEWHVPTADGVTAAAALLATCCEGAMAAVTDIATGVHTALTKKAAEDDLIAYLSVIHACCRGAADILGEVEGSSFQPTDSVNDDEEGIFTVVNTGRNKIVSACGNSSVVARLSQTRDGILRTLLVLQQALNNREDKNIFQETSEGTGTSTASMSPDVAALWMRVFEAVVMHRTWLKEASSAKQNFSANKRQGTNSTARYAKRVLERFGDRYAAQAASSAGKYSNSLYWERYDLPVHASSDRGLIQYGLIANEYAHSSARAAIHGYSQGAPLLSSCFNQLVILCGHEFESIRKDAIHCFNKLTGFGWKLEDLVQPLIRNLTTVGISYPVASGTLSILSCTLVMKRMVSRWPLMQLFLEAVPGTNAMFSGVDDMDKRQRLVELFAGVFIKYVDKWSHLPLQSEAVNNSAESERESASVFLKKMCEEVLKLSPPVSKDLVILSSSVEGSNTAMDTDDPSVPSAPPALSSGIRHELYMAYVVMHLIGHRDIAVPTEAWIWAIRQVCTRRGHPVAVLGMAVLSRLAYTAAVSAAPTLSGQQKSDALAPYLPVPTAVIDILGNDAVWKALLEGFSSIGMKKTGDSAQWSNGIDRMLRSADYIQQGYPRWITNNLFHNRTAGGAFRPAEASLICCLFLVCPSSGLVPSKVSAVLDASKGLVASNEEEAAGHNTLRSNLFGALSRLLQASYCTNNDRTSDLDAIDYLLREFLVQQTQSISLSYCYDWADAISFGYSSSRVQMTGCGTIPGVIVSNVRVVLTALGGCRDATAVEDADDGFARHAKQLVLAKGLLNADLSVVAAHGAEDFDHNRDPSSPSLRQHYPPDHSISSALFSLRHNMPDTAALSTSSEVALNLSKLFLDDSCSFVSSYRNIRVEIVEILHMLSCAHIDRRTEELKGIINRLRTLADSSNVPDSDSIENSRVRNAIEVGILWLDLASSNSTYRSADVLEGLLSVALVGSGCSDIDMAKRCHTASLRAASLIARGIAGPDGEYSRWLDSTSLSQLSDVFSVCLQCYLEHCKNDSWRVRATAVFAASIVLANNWANMTLAEKKECKNAFNEAFYDQKPEIQLLGRAGMTVYLSTKLLSELNTLASAYKKNNDIFAAREKKKRLATATGSGDATKNGADKVDNVYITTIFMSAAMLAAFPYDLPEFAPVLLHSLLRHSSVHFFHDTVTRTVQDFKRTHQDRWEEEFKKHFSSDQLDDLQGAGAQTYFT